jgi:hypothetical protein
LLALALLFLMADNQGVVLEGHPSIDVLRIAEASVENSMGSCPSDALSPGVIRSRDRLTCWH